MPRYSKEQKQEALQLYREGLTVREVHERVGISVPYIKDLLHAAGVPTRPSGFQVGNPSRTNRPHTEEAKLKISLAHKCTGHAPSLDAARLGQPKSLVARWGHHVKDPVAQLYRIYERGAVKRELDFSLSLVDFRTLLGQNCQYCGAPPSARHLNGNRMEVNGVDRVNSSKGYALDNCVACCKTCNRMKLLLSAQEFVEHCSRVAAHQGRKCPAVAC